MHLQHPRAFKYAICAAILAMTFAGSAIADEDEAPSKGNALQIYGRIDVSLDKTQAQVNSNASYGKPGASVQKLTDNTSRLGFRGTESLGAGNNAIYGLEFGINADDGSLVTPNFRYAYVGLQGQWDAQTQVRQQVHLCTRNLRKTCAGSFTMQVLPQLALVF